MKFEESPVAERFNDSVHLRTNDGQPPIYQVFDDVVPVSEEFYRHRYEFARGYGEGYAQAKDD